jgi:hypothetical protein
VAVPPHARVAPAVVAALDLAEASDVRLVELGNGQLAELARDVVTDWLRRPPRRRPVRPVIPTGPLLHARARKHLADDLVWHDRAEQDATQLVGLLFVAATPLRRTEVAETLKVSQGRLARACAVLHADPPRGLRLQEAGDQLGWCLAQSARAPSSGISGTRCRKRCLKRRWTPWRSSPTSSPSPAPTSVPSAAWTATRWSRPFERADWSPRTPALAAAAGQAFSSLRRRSGSTSG